MTGSATSPETFLNDDSRVNVVRAIGTIVAALGVMVLLAWLLPVPSVIPVSNDVAGMSFNTALSLFLCGISVICSVSKIPRAQALAGFIVLLPLVVTGAQVIDYLTGGSLQVGRIFSQFLVSPDLLATFKGGMAPNTAVGLLAFSLTQAYTAFIAKKPEALALTTGGMITAGLGLTALLGYVFGLEYVHTWRNFAGMAVHTALGLWLLGLCLLVQARHPVLQQSTRLQFLISAVAMSGGLLFDLSTPAFLGSNIIYIPVVLSAIWYKDRRIAFSFALTCGIFSTLAYLAKVEYHDDYFQRFIGRLFGIATLFIVAALIYYFKIAVAQKEDRRLRFEALMDNSPDAVITIDDRAIIGGFNPAAERMFGYAEADVVGKNVNMLMPEPYHSAHDGYLNHYGETGEERIIGTIREVNGLRRDGTVFPLDLSVSVLSEGEEKQFVGILRDLSARKKQEETLRQALNRLGAYAADLERSNQELDEFAYIASHDLKEPLRGLHNHSRFLLEDFETVLDADGKRRLNRLVFLSQRMEKLVNDLLYFSRIGRQELAVQKTDINLVIRDIQATSEQFLEERHAHVVIEGTLPTITCDTVRITEVFRNLIINGVKYNDKPEKTVEIGFLESATDESGRDQQNVFYVRDNGKGIAPEFHQDIFRIFKRLERAEDDDGTGVGLTFVRKIIARHGGRIWLTSEPGAGTTFYFTLARAEA